MIQEYRIGNITMVKGRKAIVRGLEDTQSPSTFRYYDIEEKTLHVKMWFGLQLIEPIPLTPQVLKACGFKRTSRENQWRMPLPESRLAITIYNDASGEIEYLHDDECRCSTGWDGLEITNAVKYLHQLQNLYYTLTGHDLPVKIEEL